ncbi:MAG: hypothetical protein HY557_03890, partial [Euryarchaeota archaeon]|nr:hypothetical protein [Euryarchaeota archaeon]
MTVRDVAETKGKEIRLGEHAADPSAAPKISTVVYAPRIVPRVDWQRIFVLNEEYELLSEYALNDDCPLTFEDLQRSMPLEGLKHAKPVFQGEYAFTPFEVDNL